MNKIDSFKDKYRWLSNFWSCRVMFDGALYYGVERAYVAAKSFDLDFREEVRLCKSAGKAKRLGRKVELRKDWNDVRLDIMEELVRNKFFRNANLGRKLLETGDAELIEGNNWGDKFWGVCNGEGENNLGRILMKVRGELREGEWVDCVSVS